MTDEEHIRDIVLKYGRIFSGPDGEAVLLDLMQNCHMLNGTYSDEAHKMYFREGRRSVVHDILKMLNTDLNELKKLFEQHEESEWN